MVSNMWSCIEKRNCDKKVGSPDVSWVSVLHILGYMMMRGNGFSLNFFPRQIFFYCPDNQNVCKKTPEFDAT